MTDLDGGVQRLDDAAAGRYAVVDGGEAVEHGAAVFLGFGDAVLGLGIAVLAGVAVDGGGQQIGLAVVLEIGQQLDVLVHQSHAGAGLDEGLAVFLGLEQLLGEDALLGHVLVIVHGFLEVHVLAGGPLGQDLFAEGLELPFGDALILNIHPGSAPFS